MTQNNNRIKIGYLLLMCMFGCLGPVVRGIGFSSSVTAAFRAWIAAIALILFLVLSRHKYDRTLIKKNLIPLLISGVLLAGDWIGLFESYEYTSIASATACYYICPMVVFFMSVLLFKEPVKKKHIVCAVTSFVGMVFVSGVMDGDGINVSDLKGILFAVIGALCYAAIVLINRRFPEGDPLIRTTIQLIVTALIMGPYILLKTDVRTLEFNGQRVFLLLLVGIAMTALPYVLYFSWILKMPARTISIFAYADPVVAVLISVFFMREPITVFGILGAVMIIGSSLISEL